MSFKKSLLIGLISLCSTYLFAQDETRTPGSFDGVSVSGAYSVILKKGSKEKVELDFRGGTDSDDIITEISGGILKIKTRRGVRNAHADIVVYFKKIESVYNSGSSTIEMRDTMEGNNMEVHCSGSGDVSGMAKGESISIRISGSANIDLSGDVKEIDFSSSGSGNLDAYELESEEVEIAISGSSKAKINVSESLKVSISGSGDVYYKGRPDIQRVNISGSGKVVKS